jgi:hypothetical protein
MNQLELNLEPETDKKLLRFIIEERFTDNEINRLIKEIKSYDKKQVYAVYCEITGTNWAEGHPLSFESDKAKLIKACLERRDEVTPSDEL